MSNVLVFVEQSNGKPKKGSLSGIVFGQRVAQAAGGQLHLVVVGKGVKPAADELSSFGAAKVWVVDGAPFENYLVEAYTTALAAVAKASGATLIAGATSTTTKELMPRLAGRLDAAM